ncbi:MAG: dihydrofolate reductase [Lachnospiraceae bacterium]|nr:dihydrofolate reductase [Lachnospiraceae bacterium]
MNMYMIADSKWGIQRNGRPLVSIPAEHRTMLEDVAGKVVIYGQEYLQDLPGQIPIRGCTNLIYTEGGEIPVKGAKTFASLAELRKAAEGYPSDQVYIINNEKLYKEFFKDAEVIHVAKLEYAYSADAFFEDLDVSPEFLLAADSDEQYCFDIVYNFLRYERVHEH